uniref:5-formyltetrahydrofolate cyclo-ligase n=1 Tax=Paracoccus sp. TaxID=267 RepID=UPI0028A6915F
DEADPRPAMAAHDGPVCLPVVTGPARPLEFRLHDGRLEPGRFGTSHPPADSPVLRPEVLIVPLAGFDLAGHRLGYGGGFYDRTLDALRSMGPVTAIGLAYAVQEIRTIPAEETDQPLDLIVTDKGVIQPLLKKSLDASTGTNTQP